MSLADILAAKRAASLPPVAPIPPIPKQIVSKQVEEKVEAVTTSNILTLADKIAAKRERDKNETASATTSLTQAIKALEVTQQDSPPSNVQATKQDKQEAEAAVSNIIAKTLEPTHTAKLSLAEKIALNKQAALSARLSQEPAKVLDSGHTEDPNAVITVEDEDDEEYTGAFSLNIRLNEKQIIAKEMALSGKNFCLIGAAGTGKTTTQRSVAETLLQDKRLTTTNFKIPNVSPRKYVAAPSIAFVAYTRRASANLQRAIHKNPELAESLKHNVMTIHALLEYEPITEWDDEKEREVMRFEPQRTANNPLTITHLVIEEASMLGLDLWEKLYDALPSGVQIIFIGDINQLPPVFGSSILNFALVQLPIVELTEVYRQQGDSLVLANAHHILKGESLEEGAGFNIIRGKQQVQVGQEKMANTLGLMFRKYFEAGFYDPEEDMILSPYNKQPLGTDNLNKWLAQFLGEKRQAIVYEIIAGFNKVYLAVGDKVMYEKQDAIITNIKPNPQYHGQEPQMPGVDLTRFGIRIIGMGATQEVDLDDMILGYSEFSLDELAEETTERKQQCSHVVTIVTENGMTKTLTAAGDFGANFSLGYVLTVHKAQGCEWRKVFIILHNDHSNMLNRELFYTAVTRAREEVNLIAKDSVIMKAIARQRIKGNSLHDKIEFFNSGAVDASYVSTTK